MKVSIITAAYHDVKTIEGCINSVAKQTHSDVEHIIIDGGSTDGTVEVIKRYGDKIAYWVSEHDLGIYDAMNKGIKVASGEVIGILNADDFYADVKVIENIVKAISENNVDSCYGDLVYVSRNDVNRIVRYWKSGEFEKQKFEYGWMPPHPTFFCKREIYDKYGHFNLEFPLAADYELMLRFLYKYGVTTMYIPKVLVKMRTGGTSRPGKYTLGSIKENYKAWKINDLKYPPTMLLKPVKKIFQWLSRKDVY